MTRKSAAQDCLRLLVDPLQKASPAFGDVPRKNVHAGLPSAAFPHRPRAPQVTCCDSSKKSSSGQPSAFGQSPTRIPASVRRCTLKKCSGQTTSGCLSTPTARLPKWPAAMTQKSAAQDCLRLWIYTEQKVPPAFGNVLQPFASGCRL